MARATIELINNTASALISILRRLGYKCALGGDFACYGFGIPHVPKRVEAVIFTPSEPSIEVLISQVIRTAKGHFFVSKDRLDVLLYYDHTMKGSSKKICVADISYLDTQAVHLVRDADDLPFVPISYIILQKLDEWASKSSQKRAIDIAKVVQELLKVASTMDDLDTEPLYPPLWSASRQHVLRFMAEYSGSASAWEKLGFSSTVPVAKSSLSPSQRQPSELLTIQRSPETLIELQGSELPPIADPTNTQVVIMAANDSVRLLDKCGWRSAIFGSLACFLYGSNRAPNDVDILVLPLFGSSVVTAEELKENLVVLDPNHFFMTPSQDTNSDHRILWYRLTDDPVQISKTSCKINLLHTGGMNFPNLLPSAIHWDEGLPLVPFSLLLLQKLEAWDGHRRSKDPIDWRRQRTDMEDLESLIGLSAIVPLQYSRPWSDTTLFSPEFQRLTKERVIDHCALFPNFAPTWVSLGFEI